MSCEELIRRIPSAFAVVLLLVCAACGQKEQPRLYTLHGTVVSLDQKTNVATIRGESIPGWMSAMTMEYPVKPDSEFSKLQVGERIQATVVVVTDTSFYVTDIKVVPKS